MHSDNSYPKRPVVVVGLETNKFDPLYSSYKNLSAKGKIAKVKDRCRAICEELKKTHPAAQWVFVGREYWITGEGKNHRSISIEEKKFFKDTMQELTLEYPNLSIVAGTISTHKPCNDHDILQKVKQRYSEYDDLSRNDDQWEQHIAEVNKLQKANVQDVTLIKNTCYIFQGNNIQRHGKIRPYNETARDLDENYPRRIYQPSKSKNKSHFFHLQSKGTNEIPMDYSVEICREEFFNSAIKESESQIREADGLSTTPLIHFVVSDSTPLSHEKFKGQYHVHVDSKLSMSVQENADKKSDIDVEFYKNNLLSSDTKLSKISYKNKANENRSFQHGLFYDSQDKEAIKRAIKYRNNCLERKNSLQNEKSIASEPIKTVNEIPQFFSSNSTPIPNFSSHNTSSIPELFSTPSKTPFPHD